MALYTFVLEFDGGTYVSQVDSPSLQLAVTGWSECLDESLIPKLGRQGKQELIGQVKGEVPVPLEGLINTWCSTAIIQKKLALINIIETVC